MYQGYSQGGGGIAEVMRSEGRSVVHVKLPGQSPLVECFSQGISIGVDPLVEVEPGMADEPAHVVYEGKEVALPLSAFNLHHGAVHAVGLPDVVWQFRFKTPSVFKLLLPAHQSPLLEQTVDRRIGRLEVMAQDVSVLRLFQYHRERRPP